MNGTTVLLTGTEEASQLFEGEFVWLLGFLPGSFCFVSLFLKN